MSQKSESERQRQREQERLRREREQEASHADPLFGDAFDFSDSQPKEFADRPSSEPSVSIRRPEPRKDLEKGSAPSAGLGSGFKARGGLPVAKSLKAPTLSTPQPQVNGVSPGRHSPLLAANRSAPASKSPLPDAGSPGIPSTQRPPKNIKFPVAPRPVVGIKLSPSSAFRPATSKSPLLSAAASAVIHGEDVNDILKQHLRPVEEPMTPLNESAPDRSAMADEALAALQSSNEDVAIARMVRKPAVPKPSDLFASDSDDASPPSAKKSAKATASIGDVPAKRDPRPAKAASPMMTRRRSTMSVATSNADSANSSSGSDSGSSSDDSSSQSEGEQDEEEGEHKEAEQPRVIISIPKARLDAGRRKRQSAEANLQKASKKAKVEGNAPAITVTTTPAQPANGKASNGGRSKLLERRPSPGLGVSDSDERPITPGYLVQEHVAATQPLRVPKTKNTKARSDSASIIETEDDATQPVELGKDVANEELEPGETVSPVSPGTMADVKEEAIKDSDRNAKSPRGGRDQKVERESDRTRDVEVAREREGRDVDMGRERERERDKEYSRERERDRELLREQLDRDYPRDRDRNYDRERERERREYERERYRDDRDKDRGSRDNRDRYRDDRDDRDRLRRDSRVEVERDRDREKERERERERGRERERERERKRERDTRRRDSERVDRRSDEYRAPRDGDLDRLRERDGRRDSSRRDDMLYDRADSRDRQSRASDSRREDESGPAIFTNRGSSLRRSVGRREEGRESSVTRRSPSRSTGARGTSVTPRDVETSMGSRGQGLALVSVPSYTETEMHDVKWHQTQARALKHSVDPKTEDAEHLCATYIRSSLHFLMAFHLQYHEEMNARAFAKNCKDTHKMMEFGLKQLLEADMKRAPRRNVFHALALRVMAGLDYRAYKALSQSKPMKELTKELTEAGHPAQATELAPALAKARKAAEPVCLGAQAMDEWNRSDELLYGERKMNQCMPCNMRPST